MLKYIRIFVNMVFFLSIYFGHKLIILLSLLCYMWMLIDPLGNLIGEDQKEESYYHFYLKHRKKIVMIKIVLYTLLMPFIFYFSPENAFWQFISMYIYISFALISIRSYINNHDELKDKMWLPYYFFIEDLYIPSLLWVATYALSFLQSKLAIIS